MKRFLTLMVFFSSFVMAEDSILINKKALVNQVNGSEKANTSSQAQQETRLSSHYKATFNKLLEMEAPFANNALEACDKLINAALELESGAITGEQFSSIKRKAMILWNTPVSSESEPANDSRKPLIDYRESYKAQVPQNKSINCSSTASGNTVYTNCN